MKAGQAVIAVVAGLAVGVGGGAVVSRVVGHDDAPKQKAAASSTPKPAGTTGTSNATPTTTPEPAPKLVDYTVSDPAGVQIDTLADIDKLRGAPEDFKGFIRGIVVDGLPNSDCAARLNVERVRSDGFAFGRSGENCKGHGGSGWVSFWAKRDGVWKEVIGTQDVALCTDLKAVSFPADVYGLVPKCAVGNDVVHYQG